MIFSISVQKLCYGDFSIVGYFVEKCEKKTHEKRQINAPICSRCIYLNKTIFCNYSRTIKNEHFSSAPSCLMIFPLQKGIF